MDAGTRNGLLLTSLPRVNGREMRLPFGSRMILTAWLSPGRWFSAERLAWLRGIVEGITLSRLPCLPAYGVFGPGRRPWENRVVTLAWDVRTRLPFGFSAMVTCPVAVDGGFVPVVHLGLVIIGRHPPVRYALVALYYATLAWLLALRDFRPFWITSVSMEPSIIGAVADSFDDAYPHYCRRRPPTPAALVVARGFVAQHAVDFGAGPGARLREADFVVEASCRGASDALRVDYRRTARYLVPDCNEFCRQTLDYGAGDELLQVGRCSIRTARGAVAGYLRARAAARATG